MSNDPNGAEPIGFSTSEWTIKDGRRSSGSTAYLKPILSRRNLTLQTNANVTKLTMVNGRAAGVEFVTNGRTQQMTADREVILCGGVFNSPQLLMLSGIGPAQHLRDHGIRPLVDLPVGKNLQDHLQVRIRWSRVGTSPFARLMPRPRRSGHGAGVAVQDWSSHDTAE